MSDAMTNAFEETRVGQRLDGPRFAVTRETIRAFCDASLDYNPLHLDDKYMEGSFGKTEFGGVIMHGMTNFGLVSRMLTDWLYPRGRHPPAAGDALARAGSSRRHHPAGRAHRTEENYPPEPLGDS